MKRNCEICGEIFTVYPSQIKKGEGRFCSMRCFGSWSSKNQIGEKGANWKGGKVKRNCLTCEKEFFVNPSDLLDGGGKSCSEECRRKLMRKKFAGDKNPKWKGGPVEMKCLSCGKSYSVPQGQIRKERGKFCSRKCYHARTGGTVNRECLICGKSFPAKQAQIKRRIGKFCSRSCAVMYQIKHQKKKHTGIELKTKEYLDKLGIRYEEQKVIPEGRTVADFYIPEQRIVLYADGRYWHSRPGVKDKDCRQDFLLGMSGYKVLRLGEDEINLKPKLCLNKIREFVN